MNPRVDKTNDGGFIITGSYGYGDSLALIKTNASGTEQWSKGYVVSGWDLARGLFVRQTSDGGYIISGEVGYITERIQSKNYFDYDSPLILKTDSLGNKEWMNASGNGAAHCIRQTADEGYIVVGTFGLLRLDSLGDTIWQRPYGGFSVQVTINGGYIVTGNKDVPSQMEDLWLYKTDSSGDTLWSRTYGGQKSDVGCCVQQTSDGGFIVVGETWSFGAGDDDIYLLRTDSLGLLSVTEEPITETNENWQIESRIGSSVVLMYWNRPDGFSAFIYDASGKKVDRICSNSISGDFVWGTSYPSGVYFIQIPEMKGSIKTERIVLIH